MKWPYYTIIALIIVVVVLWIQLSNEIDSNKEVTKRMNELKEESEFFKSQFINLSSVNDSLRDSHYQSKSNTKPVKEKYDANRQKILSAPDDSLYDILQKRIPAR
jgi:hypothetical protein